MRVMGWVEVINVYGDGVCGVGVLVKMWVAVWEVKVVCEKCKDVMRIDEIWVLLCRWYICCWDKSIPIVKG